MEGEAVNLRELLASGEPVACVVQGGGLRGTYGIAALAELERLGFTDRFGAVYGSSAGALNGAYFLAGQAEEGVSIYVDSLSNRRFVNPFRPFRFRPVIDIDYLIDDVLTMQVPLNREAVLTSESDLFIFLTNAMSGETERFRAQDRTVPLMELLRATAAMPLAFGKEIPVKDQKYVDGGMRNPIPLIDALDDGWANIVAILTRPVGFHRTTSSPLQVSLVRALARMMRHSAGVVEALGALDANMNRVMDILAGVQPCPNARLWAIAPPEGVRIASRLTTDIDLLRRTAKQARLDVDHVLELGPIACAQTEFSPRLSAVLPATHPR